MFIPILIVGRICYFITEIPNTAYRYDNRPASHSIDYSKIISYPEYERSDYADQYTDDPLPIMYDKYIPFEDNQRMYETSEKNVKQFLIDFEDGLVMECNIKNTGLLLQRDSSLSIKFQQFP